MNSSGEGDLPSDFTDVFLPFVSSLVESGESEVGGVCDFAVPYFERKIREHRHVKPPRREISEIYGEEIITPDFSYDSVFEQSPLMSDYDAESSNEEEGNQHHDETSEHQMGMLVQQLMKFSECLPDYIDVMNEFLKDLKKKGTSPAKTSEEPEKGTKMHLDGFETKEKSAQEQVNKKQSNVAPTQITPTADNTEVNYQEPQISGKRNADAVHSQIIPEINQFSQNMLEFTDKTKRNVSDDDREHLKLVMDRIEHRLAERKGNKTALIYKKAKTLMIDTDGDWVAHRSSYSLLEPTRSSIRVNSKAQKSNNRDQSHTCSEVDIPETALFYKKAKTLQLSMSPDINWVALRSSFSLLEPRRSSVRLNSKEQRSNNQEQSYTYSEVDNHETALISKKAKTLQRSLNPDDDPVTVRSSYPSLECTPSSISVNCKDYSSKERDQSYICPDVVNHEPETSSSMPLDRNVPDTSLGMLCRMCRLKKPAPYYGRTVLDDAAQKEVLTVPACGRSCLRTYWTQYWLKRIRREENLPDEVVEDLGRPVWMPSPAANKSRFFEWHELFNMRKIFFERYLREIRKIENFG